MTTDPAEPDEPDEREPDDRESELPAPGAEIESGEGAGPRLPKDPEQIVQEILDSEGVPPEAARRVIRVFEQQITTGAFPPPRMLAQYKRAMPDAPERIFRYAESYAEHEREMQRAMVNSGVLLRSRGQIFAFILAMTGLVGAIGLLAAGKSLAGFAVFLVAFAPIVAVFVGAQLGRDGDDEEDFDDEDDENGALTARSE
jgi:uncharacterized membrane protein